VCNGNSLKNYDTLNKRKNNSIPNSCLIILTKNMKTMTNQERKQQILQALELIIEAQSLVEEAVSGTRQEAHFNAYGQYGLQQLLGNGNRYDSSLENLIEELEYDQY